MNNENKLGSAVSRLFVKLKLKSILLHLLYCFIIKDPESVKDGYGKLKSLSLVYMKSIQTSDTTALHFDVQQASYHVIRKSREVRETGANKQSGDGGSGGREGSGGGGGFAGQG